MKRLASVALALSLLSGTAAVAAPYDHGNQGYNYGYSSQDRGDRDRRDGNGAAVVAGVGFLALAAILASQHRHHDGWYNHEHGRYRDGDGYRRGDGYNRGYDSSYGDRYSGHGDNGRR